MEENDYKHLLSTYQKKSMDLFTQLVVSETKIEILENKLRESNEIIKKLTDKVNELTQEKEEHY
jgi:CII-binding regulator of phage lambda lysogenization HflD